MLQDNGDVQSDQTMKRNIIKQLTTQQDFGSTLGQTDLSKN